MRIPEREAPEYLHGIADIYKSSHKTFLEGSSCKRSACTGRQFCSCLLNCLRRIVLLQTPRSRQEIPVHLQTCSILKMANYVSSQFLSWYNSASLGSPYLSPTCHADLIVSSLSLPSSDLISNAC
jgi:hypothetical protein